MWSFQQMVPKQLNIERQINKCQSKFNTYRKINSKFMDCNAKLKNFENKT